jgi:hypothetical protein
MTAGFTARTRFAGPTPQSALIIPKQRSSSGITRNSSRAGRKLLKRAYAIPEGLACGVVTYLILFNDKNGDVAFIGSRSSLKLLWAEAFCISLVVLDGPSRKQSRSSLPIRKQLPWYSLPLPHALFTLPCWTSGSPYRDAVATSFDGSLAFPPDLARTFRDSMASRDTSLHPPILEFVRV